MRTNHISSSEFERLLRLAFLVLPKIVIQGSSVANNRVLAMMYARYGADFLKLLRSATEIVVDPGTDSFADLLAGARERKAYGVPLEGESSLYHQQWVGVLDRHNVQASFLEVDLSPAARAAQMFIFSPDRVEGVDSRLAEKLAELECRHGQLAGNPTRTWFFELADTVAMGGDWRLAEDLRWMSTGALFLSLAASTQGELVLPQMRRRRLMVSSAESVEVTESQVDDLLQGTPFVQADWLNDVFDTIPFDMILTMRASDEFGEYISELASADTRPRQEAQARLREPLNRYLNRLSYEIGKRRMPAEATIRESRIRRAAVASKLTGYTATPVGIVASALPLVSASLTFSPLIGVALGGVAMVFTGKRLTRASIKLHQEIADAGLRTVGLTTPVNIADLLNRL